ncbi:MAG: trypsin-like peptidase domain-containing protein [Clostridia bacterium]|nr:trypsin-like peptidase domain-containing protein [Clostridia bacterium]
MNSLYKKISCLLILILSAFAFLSCSLTVKAPEGESQKESDSLQSNTYSPPIVDQNYELSFTINVTNSLDIVPDGVGVLEYIRSSVVEVYAGFTNGQSSGSGVVLSVKDKNDDGEGDVALIVTCHHVIEGAEQIVVKAIDGREYFASLVGSDPDSDIGILLIGADEDNRFENITSATWYDKTADLKVGTEVYAIGNPLGTLGGTVTSGIISAINRDVTVEGRQMTLLQTDAAINSGNSGGGLFDKDTGALLGIVNAGYASSTAQGLSFAIPGSIAIDIIEQLVGNGYIEGRYDFGVEFGLFRVGGWGYAEYFVGIDYLEDYGMFKKNGFLLQDIILSIKIGDRQKFTVPAITNANVNTVVGDLTDYLNGDNCKIGDVVVVEYRRYINGSEYQEHTVTFTVEQYVYGKN